MKILDRLDRGERPVVYGDGSQSYDFIYVRDVARANLAALRADADNAFYNVGTARAHPSRRSASACYGSPGSTLAIQYEPQGQTFVTNRIGSTVKFERETGFTPVMPLDDGLRELIRWRAAHIEEVRARQLVLEARHETAHCRPWFGERERELILYPLESGWVVQGPYVKQFEK
jgi:UDP-glucose 4-epimerase